MLLLIGIFQVILPVLGAIFQYTLTSSLQIVNWSLLNGSVYFLLSATIRAFKEMSKSKAPREMSLLDSLLFFSQSILLAIIPAGVLCGIYVIGYSNSPAYFLQFLIYLRDNLWTIILLVLSKATQYFTKNFLMGTLYFNPMRNLQLSTILLLFRVFLFIFIPFFPEEKYVYFHIVNFFSTTIFYLVGVFVTLPRGTVRDLGKAGDSLTVDPRSESPRVERMDAFTFRRAVLYVYDGMLTRFELITAAIFRYNLPRDIGRFVVIELLANRIQYTIFEAYSLYRQQLTRGDGKDTILPYYIPMNFLYSTVFFILGLTVEYSIFFLGLSSLYLPKLVLSVNRLYKPDFREYILYSYLLLLYWIFPLHSITLYLVRMYAINSIPLISLSVFLLMR